MNSGSCLPDIQAVFLSVLERKNVELGKKNISQYYN